MGNRSMVSGLPDEVKAWLDRALMEGNFSGYSQLEEALHERGHVISKSAIHRYGQKLERRMAAIRASTEAAKLLSEGASDDRDTRSEGIIAMLQSEIFETLVNLQEATDEDLDPAARVKLLSNAAKNVATLTRASVNLKRFQKEVAQQIVSAAADAAVKVAKEAGISDETVQAIKSRVLGVAA